MSYSVTHVKNIADARDTLVGLWSRNLSMRGDLGHKYDWYYKNNPLGQGTAFLLKSTSGDIVGCCGLGTRLLYVDGLAVPTGLFADFAVDQGHRTLLPALLLQRRLCGYVLETFQLGYGFPNQAAVGIFDRIGFSQLGRVHRYVKVLRYGQFLKRQMPSALAVPAGTLLDASTLLADRVRARQGRGTRLEWDRNVDRRFDQLWESVRRRYRVIGDRSAAFLRWRFVERPGLHYDIAVLRDAGSGTIAAYAVLLEKDPGTAVLADFLARSDRDLTALLLEVSRALRRRGMHTVVALFLGSPQVAQAIRTAGFRFRNEGKFVVTGLAARSAFDEAVVRRAEHWYVTEADRDN